MMNPTIIDAIAEAWATIDGKADVFLSEKFTVTDDDTGTYEGYIEEAKELIKRAERRGVTFGLVEVE